MSSTSSYADLKMVATQFSCKDLKEEIENLRNLPDDERKTLLTKVLVDVILLAENPSSANVKCLLDAGASVDGISPETETGGPLKYAYLIGLESIVEVLLKAGASPSELLQDAITAKDTKYVVRFLAAGALPQNVEMETTSPEIRKVLMDAQSMDMPQELADVKLATMADYTWPDVAEPAAEVAAEDTAAAAASAGGDPSTAAAEIGAKFTADSDPIAVTSDIDLDPYFVPHANAELGVTLLKGNVRPYVVKLISSYNWDQDQEAWVIPNDKLEDVYDILGLGYAPIVTRVEVGPNTNFHELDNDYFTEGLFKLHKEIWPSVFHFLATRRYLLSPEDKKRVMASTTTADVRKLVKDRVLNRRCDIRKTMEKAVSAKVRQNPFIATKLKNTSFPIVCVNNLDSDGYVGNALGTVLEKIRHELVEGPPSTSSSAIPGIGGTTATAALALPAPTKHNNLVLMPYNKKYEVIRGDPDPAAVEKIKKLGSYHTNNGHIVKGHLNARLRGGRGWLVPKDRHVEAEKFVFTTLPDSTRLRLAIEEWVRNKVKNIAKTAYIFSVIKTPGAPVVNTETVFFAMKECYSGVQLLTEQYGVPESGFISMVNDLQEALNMKITSDATTLLWGIVGQMLQLITPGVTSYQQFRDAVDRTELFVNKCPVPELEGLNSHESLFLAAFGKIQQALLRTGVASTMKSCIGAVAISMKLKNYHEIKSIYDSKIVGVTTANQTENIVLLRTLRFKKIHVERLLKNLTDLPLNCKILFLTALEFYVGLPVDKQQKLTRRLKVLSS